MVFIRRVFWRASASATRNIPPRHLEEGTPDIVHLSCLPDSRRLDFSSPQGKSRPTLLLSTWYFGIFAISVLTSSY